MVNFVHVFLVNYSDTAVAFFGAYFKVQQLIVMTVNGLIQGCLPIMRFNYRAKKAVSYTHLDVYKRQVTTGYVAKVKLTDARGQADGAYTVNAGNTNITYPYGAPKVASIMYTYDKNTACLLYTSRCV